MSIYEENKFTKAFSFVHVTVDCRSDTENGGMLRRAIAGINRIYPRPRFVAMSGSPSAASQQRTSWSTQKTDCVQQYKEALRLLAPNIAVVTVPGATDFPNGKIDMKSLQTFRTRYGADYYSFWIGRIMYIVLNSVLLNVEASEDVNLLQERRKQLNWFEREIYVGRTRGTQVHLLISNPLFLKKPLEKRSSMDVNVQELLMPIASALPIIETLKLSWGRYIFSSHPARNVKGIHRGSTTSYEECDVRSYTTANIYGPVPDNTETDTEEKVATAKNAYVGGVRIVRVFEAFAKPEFFKIHQMPSSIDLDLKTNAADEEEGNVVPASGQANAAPTWMSTPTGGETKGAAATNDRRPEPVPFKYVDGKKVTRKQFDAVDGDAEESGEEGDDEELIIEDVTDT